MYETLENTRRMNERQYLFALSFLRIRFVYLSYAMTIHLYRFQTVPSMNLKTNGIIYEVSDCDAENQYQYIFQTKHTNSVEKKILRLEMRIGILQKSLVKFISRDSCNRRRNLFIEIYIKFISSYYRFLHVVRVWVHQLNQFFLCTKSQPTSILTHLV